MNSFRSFKMRASRIGASLALILTTAAPALLPDLAAADTVTNRSIALSSSTKAATGVTYHLKFTTVQAAGAFVVQFCSNSPLIGSACTAPTGFSSASAATSTSGYTIVGADTNANQITTTGTFGAASAIDVEYTGITNPTNAGTLYARVVSYVDGTAAHLYTDTAPGTHKDDGGIAMSITDQIGVSAAVLESLTFCVSGAAIASSGCSSGLQAPSLTLGETTGSVKALSAGAVSTGDIWTQISTNAASGAVVSMKSNNTCGGLKRLGAAVCDIAPALQTGIAIGEAKVGVKVAADTTNDSGLSASGTFQAKTGSGYNGSAYALNYLSNATSGVTSIYGDPILETNGTQPSNKEMKLTFGASITNNTPAGSYANNYSLIATGTF